MNKKVFEPTVLGSINLKNRIIRSATHEGMADEAGYPTEMLKNTYIQLAKGTVGAIITGYAGIQQNGRSPLYRMNMISDDSYIDHYKDLVDTIHEYDTPIIMQIVHCGRQTRSIITGERPVAPSAIRDKCYNEEIPKELTELEIEEIINNFVNAIERAKKAGFDGVQLHAAHGYLLSSFLSPYMNHRKDRWGGTTENRFRIIDEIYKDARKRVGNYPILVKMNAYDGRKNGMRIKEAIKIAKLLEKSGCSAIEVSCGIWEDGFYSVRVKTVPIDLIMKYSFNYKKFATLPFFLKSIIKLKLKMHITKHKPLHNYNVEAAAVIKREVSIPVIVVGGIRAIGDISNIIENGKADFVSMCRPFISEPDIVKKFEDDRQKVSKCISCCNCAILLEENPIRCCYS
ncbi:MAG: NADH:flavin oxidoreductase [Candidatus Omnitrophota bacterium]